MFQAFFGNAGLPLEFLVSFFLYTFKFRSEQSVGKAQRTTFFFVIFSFRFYLRQLSVLCASSSFVHQVRMIYWGRNNNRKYAREEEAQCFLVYCSSALPQRLGDSKRRKHPQLPVKIVLVLHLSVWNKCSVVFEKRTSQDVPFVNVVLNQFCHAKLWFKWNVWHYYTLLIGTIQ